MKPVQYNAENQKIVETFSARPTAAADDWNLDDLSPVRKQIKDHYIAEQKQTCCYCKVHFPTNHNMVWDAEHVIARKLEPRFQFEPRNLAIACKDCNGAKGDKEVRGNPKRKTFPEQSTDYTIVHPHFDQYDQHIQWFGRVCRPLTDKGVFTIEKCKLLRLSFNALGDSTIPPHPTYYDQIGKLIDAKDHTEAVVALAAISKYLETVPQN